jgi:hypothetical protein
VAKTRTEYAREFVDAAMALARATLEQTFRAHLLVQTAVRMLIRGARATVEEHDWRVTIERAKP